MRCRSPSAPVQAERRSRLTAQSPGPPPSARRSTSCRSARWCAIERGASSAISAQKDFIVRSGRAAADSRFPRAADGPVKARGAVDISGSMRVGPRPLMRSRPPRTSFRASRGGDEAAVFTLRHGPGRVHAVHVRRRALEARSNRVQTPFGQTSLYDAIAQTARAVAAEGARRRTVCRSAARWWCSPTASTRAAG